MPAWKRLRYELRDGAAWITVDRPEKLNALDRQTVAELASAAQLAAAEPGARAVVLTGAGEKAFVAGADIEEMAGLDPAGAQEFSGFLQETLDRFERCPKPVLAAVNGFALGGGCELAMACHLRFAAANARFGQPEVGLGLIPGAGGTQRLPRLVGRGRALDIILGGAPIDATEALRIGLVDRVCPPGELTATVASYVAALASKSPRALARALEAVLVGGELPQSEALRLEAALFGLCFATEDMREGTRAFLEKRKPTFPGR
ncbi:MAG TPA: enoyl-CoA hydratase-related protein [Candidatus Polarisedimenticolaceae bacterium]|nr:enoyl-CoA hydratase-related protein [Candidatus Polarisedimenticolaceae bacterium]